MKTAFVVQQQRKKNRRDGKHRFEYTRGQNNLHFRQMERQRRNNRHKRTK